MKTLEIFDSFGDKIVVEPELALYTTYDFMENKMPGLGIELFSYDEDGERDLYSVFTVNFGEFLSAKNCAYIDTNNNSFTSQLLDMGFCQDTGMAIRSGFCTYPLWKFDEDFLREIDVNGLYDVYEKKFDKYMNEGPELPVWDREGEVVNDVLSQLNIKDADVAFDKDGLVVTIEGNEYHGAEFYRYLLGEVCEFDKDGKVNGLFVDLCVDFKDLCEHNGVNYTDYINSDIQRDIEYVITMSSGGTIQDFMTCSSRKEAEEICEGYEWSFMDENEFEWNLDIEERKVSLVSKLADASARSQLVDGAETGRDEYEKD